MRLRSREVKPILNVEQRTSPSSADKEAITRRNWMLGTLGLTAGAIPVFNYAINVGRDIYKASIDSVSSEEADVGMHAQQEQAITATIQANLKWAKGDGKNWLESLFTKKEIQNTITQISEMDSTQLMELRNKSIKEFTNQSLLPLPFLQNFYMKESELYRPTNISELVRAYAEKKGTTQESVIQEYGLNSLDLSPEAPSLAVQLAQKEQGLEITIPKLVQYSDAIERLDAKLRRIGTEESAPRELAKAISQPNPITAL